MKNLILFILVSFISVSSFANEIELKTTVKSATVFLKGAQITRTGSQLITQGETNFIIKGISESLDPSSIKVEADGDFTILSIKAQKNYYDKDNPSESIMSMLKLKRAKEDSIQNTKTLIQIIESKISLIRENKGFKNHDKATTEDIKSTIDLFRRELEEAEFEKLKNVRLLKQLEMSLEALSLSLKEQYGKDQRNTQDIFIDIRSEKSLQANFKISYKVESAGWFPKYDIKVKNLNDPLELIHKAEFYQNTGNDWENIKISFSNANPDEGNSAPELEPWRLNYYRNTRKRNSPSNNQYFIGEGKIGGIIRDETGEPMIGANILVKGTTIGTITDIDGSYELTVPQGAKSIVVTFTGYTSQELPIQNGRMDVMLESGQVLNEVVVTGLAGKTSGVSASNYTRAKKVKQEVISTVIEYQTNMEFSLDIPYSINTGGAKKVVNLKINEVPATYNYLTIPKIEESAFLIAKIKDWQELNIMAGEANLYFEKTFIGSTLLNPDKSDEELIVSLGRDKNIVINREVNQKMKSKKTLGSKTQEVRSYEITIQNNKKEEIDITVIDQIPIPVIKDIEVKVLNQSNADLIESKGELVWKLQIPSRENKKLINSYQVKYPKSEYVELE